MNEFRITFIAQGNKIITEKSDYTKIELSLFNTILRERNLDELNIILKSKRRAVGNRSFVDFESSNNLTIKENIRRYLNEDTAEEIYDRTVSFNKQLLNELNLIDLN